MHGCYALAFFFKRSAVTGIERSAHTAHVINIGVNPEFSITIPNMKDDIPVPQYVIRSIMPLIDAVLPVSIKRRGNIERIDVLIADIAA